MELEPKEILNNKLLANYLRIDISVLETVLGNPYRIIEKKYPFRSNILDLVKWKIPKKNSISNYREIHSPVSDNLISMLIILNNRLNSLYSPPESVHGYVKGRGIRSNAAKHLERKYILSMDIKDFFGSISQDYIIEVLQKMGFPLKTSKSISKIVTVNGKLVQGFHTSPTLANIVFKGIDLELEKVSREITYTRYADDIYFSSNDEITIEEKVAEIINKNGLELNHKKTKLMWRGGKQYVTGLTVFDNLKPRISKRIKRRLRLEIYFIEKYGLKEHVIRSNGYSVKKYFENAEIRSDVYFKISSEKERILGWLYYINSIEPDFTEKYLPKFINRKMDSL